MESSLDLGNKELGALASCLKECGWKIWEDSGVFYASLTKDGYGISGIFSESFTDIYECPHAPSFNVTLASGEWELDLDYLLFGDYTGAGSPSCYDQAGSNVYWANEEPPDAQKAEKVLWDLLEQIEKCMGDRP